MVQYDLVLSYGHGKDTWSRTRGRGVVVNGQVYEEHEANADVGERLREILEDHGLKVLVVQPPNEKEVPLQRRTDAANAAGVKLYWSIHFNGGSKAAHGVCSFYWPGSEGEQLAKNHITNMNAAGFELHGDGLHPVEVGTWTNLHEVRETNMTAILTENGFMTNDADFSQIFGSNKETYRQRLAETHAKSILGFFDIRMKKKKNEKQTEQMKDIIGTTHEESIRKALDAEAFHGYPDGTFKPEQPLTRGQFAAVLDRLGLLDK